MKTLLVTKGRKAFFQNLLMLVFFNVNTITAIAVPAGRPEMIISFFGYLLTIYKKVFAISSEMYIIINNSIENMLVFT